MIDSHTVTDCAAEPVYNYVLAILICIGGTVSYLPQYYSLYKSEQFKGISEMSFLIMNIAGATLAANSFILNYWQFPCYNNCSFWICTGRLLPLIQIAIGWFVCIPLYLILIRNKIKGSNNRLLSDIRYILTYLGFILVMVIIGIFEKNFAQNSSYFFSIAAIMLGIISALCSCLIWIPQIIKLIKHKDPRGLSLLMFFLQTPGNIMIIILQILYKQSWTTWISYLVLFIEQATIIVILLVLKWRSRNVQPIIFDVIEEDNGLN